METESLDSPGDDIPREPMPVVRPLRLSRIGRESDASSKLAFHSILLVVQVSRTSPCLGRRQRIRITECSKLKCQSTPERGLQFPNHPSTTFLLPKLHPASNPSLPNPFPLEFPTISLILIPSISKRGCPLTFQSPGPTRT